MTAQTTQQQSESRQERGKLITDYPDSEMLLNRCELERMLQKARLEGAIGYITFLCQALDEEKIRTLDQLEQAIRGDWASASSAAGELMMENLLLDGYANGLMANIQPEKQDNKP